MGKSKRNDWRICSPATASGATSKENRPHGATGTIDTAELTLAEELSIAVVRCPASTIDARPFPIEENRIRDPRTRKSRRRGDEQVLTFQSSPVCNKCERYRMS